MDIGPIFAIIVSIVIVIILFKTIRNILALGITLASLIIIVVLATTIYVYSDADAFLHELDTTHKILAFRLGDKITSAYYDQPNPRFISPIELTYLKTVLTDEKKRKETPEEMIYRLKMSRIYVIDQTYITDKKRESPEMLKDKFKEKENLLYIIKGFKKNKIEAYPDSMFLKMTKLVPMPILNITLKKFVEIR